VEAFRKRRDCKLGVGAQCKECVKATISTAVGNGLKKCNKCGKELPLDKFRKKHDGKYGVVAICKECERVINAEYDKTEKGKARFETFRKTEKAKKIQADYRKTPLAKDCKKRHEATPKCKATRDAYRSSPEGAEKTKATNQKYKKTDKHRQTVRAYYLKRKKIAGVGLDNSMRSGIWSGLKGKKAGRKWESLVGYTLEDLMQRIESLFQPGMDWTNYGKWHLDHIIPRAAFFYTDETDIDFKRCWGLDNLQPLWMIDNCTKYTKIIKPFQPSLDFQRKNGRPLDKS
jgi:hypothetical protein